MQLLGEPMTLVLGGDIRHETLLHKSMDNVLTAQVAQFSGVYIEGVHNLYAAFAELNTPITKKFDATFALHADKSGPTSTELIQNVVCTQMLPSA